jgi:hypothetical protein
VSLTLICSHFFLYFIIFSCCLYLLFLILHTLRSLPHCFKIQLLKAQYLFNQFYCIFQKYLLLEIFFILKIYQVFQNHFALLYFNFIVFQYFVLKSIFKKFPLRILKPSCILSLMHILIKSLSLKSALRILSFHNHCSYPFLISQADEQHQYRFLFL